MRFIYHPDALIEYADATLYYDERVPGLGADFTRVRKKTDIRNPNSVHRG